MLRLERIVHPLVGKRRAELIEDLGRDPDSGGDGEDFQQRYPKAQVRDFDGVPHVLERALKADFVVFGSFTLAYVLFQVPTGNWR